MRLPSPAYGLALVAPLFVAHAARAADSAPPPAPSAPAPAPADPGNLFLHASFGVNVYTHAAAYNALPQQTLTPGDHPTTFEQVGVGYWVDPHIRLQLTGMLGETFSGLKPGASALTHISVIPWIVFTDGGLFGGAGPLLAPRALGIDAFNGGLFTCVGYGMKLGDAFSLALAVQMPMMFGARASVAITPALVLGYRL